MPVYRTQTLIVEHTGAFAGILLVTSPGAGTVALPASTLALELAGQFREGATSLRLTQAGASIVVSRACVAHIVALRSLYSDLESVRQVMECTPACFVGDHQALQLEAANIEAQVALMMAQRGAMAEPAEV